MSVGTNVRTPLSLKKKEKKLIRKKTLGRPTVPNFFGDVSGKKEHFLRLSRSKIKM